jgi:hypothetical protein
MTHIGNKFSVEVEDFGSFHNNWLFVTRRLDGSQNFEEVAFTLNCQHTEGKVNDG